MKIVIQTNKHIPLFLVFPNWLILNKFGLRIGMKYAQNYVDDQIPIFPTGSISRLRREIKRIRAAQGSIKIVQIETSSGVKIEISL